MKQMHNYKSNYHSHCNFCDGKQAPEEYVKMAIAMGVSAYGFSSHAPLSIPCAWTMKPENILAYIDVIGDLKKHYKGQLAVLCSLEIDYIPDISGPKTDFIKSLGLDYTIGSVHFVDHFPDGRYWEIDNTTKVFREGLEQIFHGDIRAAISRYYTLTREMVSLQTPDIVGHMDKIKMHNRGAQLFSENDDWYKKEIESTLEVIKEAGSIIEVNTRGMYKKMTVEPYPSYWILERILKMKIPITINSDAHTTSEIVSSFDEVEKTLTEIGFREKMFLQDGEWIAKPIF